MTGTPISAPSTSKPNGTALASGKPVLVTGAAGFIGARFVEALNHAGVPAISVDKPAFFENREEHRGIDFGRIIAQDQLLEILASDEVPELSAIVHMGACSDTSERDVEFLRRNNIEYSQKLWAHATLQGLPLVYASSAATYGGGELGYDDDESAIEGLRPLNPYGESKRLFDLWALAQERQGHHPPSWAGFKFFNVYGFGEKHKGSMASVVLHAFNQIRDRGIVKLFKSHREGIAHGEQKRDFVFVDDVVDVMMFALNKPIPRGIFNLGTGKARTFLDLVRATFRATGKPEQIEFIDTPPLIREHYQYFTQARMDRLRAEGYAREFTSLEKGAEAYVSRLLKG